MNVEKILYKYKVTNIYILSHYLHICHIYTMGKEQNICHNVDELFDECSTLFIKGMSFCSLISVVSVISEAYKRIKN